MDRQITYVGCVSLQLNWLKRRDIGTEHKLWIQ